jgi:RNA 3'-terminal phosphate cyclase (ATP)
MDWQPGFWTRTRSAQGASTNKRWVTHARHDSPSPHYEVLRPTGGTKRGAGGVSVGSEPGSKLVTLDGSSGEGGGQILRTALTLSLLTGRPFRIVKIRANRDKPGLRPQHLKAVEAAAMLGNAEVIGGSAGSRDLTFRPGQLEPRDLRVDIGTAGATALVLQTLHLPLALRATGPVRLTLTGGTYNESAPSFPFLEATWRAHLAGLGMPVALAMPRAGFYPEGGGTLEAWIEPAIPQALVLENRGELVKIRGMAETNKLHSGIRLRMLEHAVAELEARGFSAEIDSYQIAGPSPGASITLIAEFSNSPPAAFVGLGKRGKSAELVADDAVGQVLDYLEAGEAAVDLHSADQILLPLAFAEGRSVFTVTQVTEHLRTNVETIGAFLDRPIRIEAVEDGQGGRIVVG